MKIADRQDIMTFLIHLLVWIPMMVVPAVISYFIVPTTGMASLLLSRALVMLGPMFVIYMITYYLNVPYLLFKGKKLWFAVASVVLILGVNIHLIFADMSTMPSIVQMGFYAWLATSISTNILVILAAIGIRSFVRSHKTQIELQEKLRKTAEAELVWLKNQLNPHFLFNSLNNISSLTQIDPDQAQDAIGQLSDLLRYALYESNKPEVPLSGEVEFMRNYISLMRLRCSSTTKVEEDFRIAHNSHQIVPLLFVSFIENAFKHGTSNNQASHISISLREEPDRVVFDCRNTNLPKDAHNHSGSGIGLENTRRRLELSYPNHYEWKQDVVDGEFRISIAIRFDGGTVKNS